MGTTAPWIERREVCAAYQQLTRKIRGMLGVWSRNEVVRVDLEHSRVGCPGAADCLKRCFPLQRFEVFGKVVIPTVRIFDPSPIGGS